MGLDNLPIFGIRAAVFAFGAVFFPIAAASHEVTAGIVITIGLHAQAVLAKWCTIPVNGDGIRNCFWPAAFIIQVDECADPSAFKNSVSGVIVHSGVQAHIFDGNSRYMFFQFMESDKEADRIMAPCAGEAQEQGEIRSELPVIAGELE